MLVVVMEQVVHHNLSPLYWHLGELKILEVEEVPTVLALIMQQHQESAMAVPVLFSSLTQPDKYLKT
jgi:hypothetical protein